MDSKRLRKIGFTALLCIAAAFGLAACNGTGGTDASTSASSDLEGLTGGVAATVNGVEISEDEVTRFIESYRSSGGMSEEDAWGSYLAGSGMTPESFREQVIDYFISQKLVAQAAEEQGINVTDEEIDEQVSAMRANYSDDEAWQAALASAGTTEEDYRASVLNNMLSSKLEEKISSEAEPVSDEDMLEHAKDYADYFSGAKRSSHILFGTDDEQTAKDVLAQIKDGSLSFEDAVTEYSQDSSASNGGDVGWDMLSNFVTEYTDALAELDEGEMSDVVKSQFGYHIIKCTEVFTAPEGGVTSLDQVPEALVDYIRSMIESSAQSNAVYEWYAEYKKAANIVINDMPEGLPYDVDMSKYEKADDSSSSEALAVEETVSSDLESSEAAESEEGEADAGEEASEEGEAESSASSEAA